MSGYNVTNIIATIATVQTRKLLIVIGADHVPRVSVYDEHTGETQVRMIESNLANLRYALTVLETGVV